MPDSMATAKKIVEGMEEVMRGDAAFKAEVVGDSIDLLVGNDPTALVRNAPGLSPDMLEAVSDFVIKQLKAQVLKRLTEPPVDPPVIP